MLETFSNHVPSKGKRCSARFPITDNRDPRLLISPGMFPDNPDKPLAIPLNMSRKPDWNPLLSSPLKIPFRALPIAGAREYIMSGIVLDMVLAKSVKVEPISLDIVDIAL